MRRFFTWMTVGALLGAVVATLVAPWVLQTLLASTGAQDAMCQCTQLVANTSSLLIRTQLYGALAGAIVVPTFAFFAKRIWGTRESAASSTAEVASTGTPREPG